MLTDELLLSAARLHNNYAGGLPRLMFEHSRLKDDKGEGLTGLSLEVEAAVLGLQVLLHPLVVGVTGVHVCSHWLWHKASQASGGDTHYPALQATQEIDSNL